MVSFLKKYLFPILVISVLVFLFFKYKVAPGIELDQLNFKHLDGSAYNKSELDGKYIFLNVMATWCGPCRAELPSIDKANKILKDQGFVFLVVSDEQLTLLNKFKTQYNYSYTYLQMQNSRKELGIHTIPTTYILGPDGAVLFKKIGGMEWDAPENIEMLKELASK